MPKRDEKPIHGLVSDKNFIVANAVENILAGKCQIAIRQAVTIIWMESTSILNFKAFLRLLNDTSKISDCPSVNEVVMAVTA